LHLLLEVDDVVALEVVYDQESTAPEPGAKPLHFGVGGNPDSNLDYVGDGVLEQRGIVESDDRTGIGPGANGAHFLENPGEVRLGPGIVVGPHRSAPEVPQRVAVAD